MAGIPYVTGDSLDLQASAWLAAVRPWDRGRVLPDLSGSALLVLDLQQYFADPGSHAFLPALPVVLPRVLELISRFAAAGRPVVLTRHGSVLGDEGMMARWWSDQLCRGEPRARLVDELAAWAEKPEVRVLDKARYSAFSGTDLDGWLARRGCDSVVICGVMTHLCCESTARDAFMRDLQPVIVADGCASIDEELHLGALRALAHGFAVIATAEQVAAVCSSGPPRQAGAGGPRRLDSLPRRLDLAVVGAGPGGIAAAIQARRAGVDVGIFDADRPGGQALTADWIENYPGFPGGIPGRSLMRRFEAQAQQWRLSVHRRRVQAVSVGSTGLELVLERHHHRVAARAVILATGSAPRSLGPTLEEGVVYRVDHLTEVRGRRVLVVGGGEAALDQALLARRLGAAAVTLAMRSQAPRAMALLVQRAEERGIVFLPRTELDQIEPAAVVGESRQVVLRRGEERLRLPFDAVVVCIGKTPCLPGLPAEALVNGKPATDRIGRTPVPGLYMVGDVHRGRYRQVAIAVGDGVAAAMDAARFIGGEEWRT